MRANNPPISFIMNMKNILENAVNELKDAGIIKTKYSTNRIKLCASRKNFNIGNKAFYYMDCWFYLFDNPNIMPFVTDKMKDLLKYYHTSNKPFNIEIVVPASYLEETQSLEKPYLFNYYSYRFNINEIVNRPNYIDYKFDERRFDRSDVHLKYMPAIFEQYEISHYKSFTTAIEVKNEIDKDINSFNKFMEVARPYITGEKDNIFTDLMKQKTDKTKEIDNIQSKLFEKERELEEINYKIKVTDEKIKTEFIKEMSIEEDFHGQ